MHVFSRRRFLGASALLATQSGYGWAADPIKLTFLLVNDIYRMNEVEGRGGLPKLAAIVKAERARNPNTLFAHAGDTISPSLYSGFDQGAHMIALFNDLPPDIFVPGNHEFDFGSDVYLKRMGEAQFPVLAANLRNADGTPLPGHRDTMMIERAGLKIGFTGATLDTTGLLSSPGPLVFSDTLSAIQAGTSALRAAGADLTIAVVHADKATGRRLMEAGAADMILSGHNHDLHIDYDGRSVLAESGEDANYVVAVDVTVRLSTGPEPRKVFWHPNFRIFDTADVKPDPIVLAHVKNLEADLTRNLNVTIATLQEPLDSRTRVVRGGEAAIGNLFADAMRVQSGSDFALLNSGSIRGNREYPANAALSRLDIMTEMPFGNRILVTRVSGAVLRTALENGFSKIDTPAGRFPQISGFRVVADFGADAGHRVVSMQMNGMPLDESKSYTIAINDFMLRGGDGYSMLAGDLMITSDAGDRLIANEVMTYAQKLGTVSAKVEGRISGK